MSAYHTGEDKASSPGSLVSQRFLHLKLDRVGLSNLVSSLDGSPDAGALPLTFLKPFHM